MRLSAYLSPILLAAALVAAAPQAGAYSGSGGVWATKLGTFTSKNFTGTMAGIRLARDYAPGGVIQIGPGVYTADDSVNVPAGTLIVAIGDGPVVFNRTGGWLAQPIFKVGAVSGVTIRGITFNNASQAATSADITAGPGASDFKVERCRWTNLANRAAELVKVNGAADLQNNRIHILSNTVVGGTTTDTWNSFQVFDGSDVHINWNEIDGWGAIKYETNSALTTIARRIEINGNTFHNVNQTHIFVMTNGTTYIDGVDVSHNRGFLSSMSVLKGMVNIGEQASGSNGVTTNVTCNANIGRGQKGYFLNFGGGAGGGKVIGLTATGNVFDGRLEAADTLVSTSESSLISFNGVKRFTFTGNVARYTGRSGIRGSGSHGAITSNVLEFCAQNNLADPTPVRESAIYITPTAEGILVHSNTIYNSHNATLLASFDTGAITLDNYGTVLRIRIRDNQIVDDRAGSAGMKYGIKVGVAGATTTPDSTTVGHNDVTGATVAKWINYGSGARTMLLSGDVPFNALGTPSNGSVLFCTDCTKATPCAGGGTGALAKRANGAWDCN